MFGAISRCLPIFATLTACLSLCDAVALADPVATTETVQAVPMPLAPFQLNEVRLLDGPVKHEMDINAAYLLNGPAPELAHETGLTFDVDRLLYTFRHTAGLPTPGTPMGTCDALDHEIRGATTGDHLCGMAGTYAATGNPEMKRRVDQLIDGLAEVQAKHGNGYLAAWPESFLDAQEQGGPAWARYYVIDKILDGLYSAYINCGNEKARELFLNFVRYFVNRFEKLTPEQMSVVTDMARYEKGSIALQFANAYGLTGDESFRKLARQFLHDNPFKSFSEGRDFNPGQHGNIMTPEFCGAARYYELTGDEMFRGATLHFWELAAHHRSYATGGASNGECFSAPDLLSKTVTSFTVEQCIAFNMLRVTPHVLCWTGRADVGDFYERLFFNHAIGCQSETPGVRMHFFSLAFGMPKLAGLPTGCCYGSASKFLGMLNSAIYFKSADALYTNLYVASRVDWKEKGLTLEQATRFPDEDTARFAVRCAAPQKLALKFRVPYWATKGVEARVNGTAIDTAGTAPSSWLAIERTWNDGDTIELRLPMSLHLAPMPDNEDMVAVMYGPLVLAGLTGPEMFVDSGTPSFSEVHQLAAPDAQKTGVAAEVGGAGASTADDTSTPTLAGTLDTARLSEAAARGGMALLSSHGRPLYEAVPAVYHFTGDRHNLEAWIKPVPDKVNTFRTIGQPRDVTFIPQNTIRPDVRWKSRDQYTYFGIYWMLFTGKDDPRLAQAATRLARWWEYEGSIIDRVIANDPASEQAHGLKGEKMAQHEVGGWPWRAAPLGWFSYDLKVAAPATGAAGTGTSVADDRPLSLFCLYSPQEELQIPIDNLIYSGDDVGEFDILVDGQVIAHESLPLRRAAPRTSGAYPIPVELTRGKEQVTVTFKAAPGKQAGKIFECAIVPRR